MTSYSDHFSKAATNYALYRPHYPEALFDWLATQAPNRERVWDCGTGSGQAARPLANRFSRVLASDPSEAQIRNADRATNIDYVVMTAEQPATASHSVSLVTVAQALHWFDLPTFYAEAKRALVPNGVLAVWTYQLCEVGDADIDARVKRFYTQEIGAWWPAERALVDAGYGGLPFPFRELAPPPFAMESEWSLEQFAGYVSTWSAVTRYRAQQNADPVSALAQDLAPLWRDQRRVRWPLDIRAGVHVTT